MDEYIDVKIDVFEYAGQRARVRKNITVAMLIEEIFREFDDISADSPGRYAIYLKDDDRPLNSAQTLTELDIQPQDHLVFDYVRQTLRKMLEPEHYAILREESTGKEFDIQWTPALVGRPTAEADHNLLLAVNVRLLENGMTISRRHAQLSFSNGHYYIEPLAENNPVFLQGKEVPPNTKRELRSGDRLIFGHSQVAMIFSVLGKTASQSQVREHRSQVTPTTPAPASMPEAVPVVDVAELPMIIFNIERASLPDSVGKTLIISNYPYTLGRTLPQFSDEGEVSRRHAEVTYAPHTGAFYITDLQSTNGVTVNDIRIQPNQPVEIKVGTRIGLGKTLLLRFAE